MRGRIRSRKRGSAILYVLFMVLSISIIIVVTAEVGMGEARQELRYERDAFLARTWDAALSLVDDKSANGSLGALPTTIPISLNGVNGTLTVSDNSASLANSLLVTTTLTASDGTIYAKSGILPKIAGYLNGSYWWTNGTGISSNYLAWNWMMNNPSPTGTFQASLLNYLGLSTTNINNWLSTDNAKYTGANHNLTDGVVLLNGFITTPAANTIIKATSEYGASVSIDGDKYMINNAAGNSLASGTVTIPTAGTYPIFATYFNHTGSIAADLQLQWNPGSGYVSIPTSNMAPLNQNWAFNGSAVAYGNGSELVDSGANEAGSAWVTSLQQGNSFHCSFDFLILNPNADGFTFTIQNNGTSALGGNGLGLGYSGIGNSIALTFQLTSPSNYWNLTDNGIVLTSGGITLSTYGINLASGDLFHCSMTQSGSNFSATLTDRVTGKSVTGTQSGFTPSTYLGGNTGFIGFTSSTGATTSTVYVTNLNYGP